jgi:cobyrinic acid a,c-diamide synthase
MKRLLVSAAHKSSGKTTVAIGLAAVLAARGEVVQAFKKGPDYIDPIWLALASGRPCYNLDPYLSSPEEIRESFVRRMTPSPTLPQGGGRTPLAFLPPPWGRVGEGVATLALIEGNKGLHDGLDLHGSNSNAALAVMLQAPVVLVIDARGMTRGVAPIILGFQAFEPRVNIAGVILNQLGGARHESKLRAVIEHYTSVPVVGAIARDAALAIEERHLGLVPGNEASAARDRIEAIAARVAASVDLGRVLEIAARAPPVDPHPQPLSQGRGERCSPSPLGEGRGGGPGSHVRIAIARDEAFGFYYADDLEALADAGAEIVPFDALHDPRLPEADALFIGGGFPEERMDALSANAALRAEIRRAVAAGLPTYAECGGLMYLARGIEWKGRRAEMVGAIPADIVMHERPVGRGYVHLRETGRGPWPSRAQSGPVRAHEFHYSSVENLPADAQFAYDVERGHGIDGRHDGFVQGNLLASYAHLRSVAASPWAGRFVEFVRSRLHA